MMTILLTTLFQFKVFLLIMAIMVLIVDMFHVVSTIYLKNGKIIPSVKSLTLFGVSLAYVITMIICGI